MDNKNNEREECESVGAPMVRIVLTDFKYESAYQYLTSVPVSEAEINTPVARDNESSNHAEE